MTQRLLGVTTVIAYAVALTLPAHARATAPATNLHVEQAHADDDRASAPVISATKVSARAIAGHRHKTSRVRQIKAKSASRSGSLTGVVAPLAAKAREIVDSCGSVVVSGVARRGSRSNHPRGRAIDLAGNPSCIYAHLLSWPGGVSTDYARAPGRPHVHVSYNPGGQEWGLRFTHRGYSAQAKSKRLASRSLASSTR
jgi:hypothetical protein